MNVRPPTEVSALALDRLVEFQNDLPNMSPSALYARHIIRPESAVLTVAGSNELQTRFKAAFGATVEVRLVGSASCGFSLKQTQRYTPFDFARSDLDVAMVDRELFDNIWQDVHEFVNKNKYWAKLDDFRLYLYDGWIRPDYLPPRIGGRWFDFFRMLQSQRIFGDLEIRAGLYASEYYLEYYQCKNILTCKQV